MAILTVENPLAPQRELLVFRDSFAGSLIPLLLPAYSRITLIDTRYVDSRYLAEFVDFHGQQVLLLYSEAVIRSASVLR